MKKGLLFLSSIFFSVVMTAQVTTSTVTMSPSYANQVYFKLATQTSTPFANTLWDIAFYRKSNMSMAIRTNDAKGIATYEASNNLADWATIDVANEANWTRLYNSETIWERGAFDNGSETSSPFGYGWGVYNMATHKVTGTIIFVLKYANNTYKKVKMVEFFGGYTFIYSSWDGTAWSADQTAVVPNTSNPNNNFNYYSLETNAQVVAEPASTDWDLLFTKYMAMQPSDVMYSVTGVLHHPDVQVAENASGASTDLTYSEDINTIGFDWKTLDMATFAYVVDTQKAFFVKLANGTIYKINFLTFAGSSTGVITFNQEDVTAQLGSETFENKVTFGVYPNPSTDKKINLIYEMPSGNSDKNLVTIYSITGAQMYQTTIDSNSGFFSKELDLNFLNSGMYLLKFDSGDYSTTKKIILK
ncbi:hypothetical protein J2X31_002286 [Flavobacterium arsenatis]|uniref:Secretion system C-terminal sorting domain-containing protein n=1 Tax=Flavobacterium arsenatis TaxID=1484332 RepID=A0ABU1TQM1_9FLAO|nr:HmuY family protein [Flavobacterium arsenatis]MDR6968269.1 hypothetical protein [Flavobacterium arsenatis]